jgi:hypothetical protein
MGPPVVGCLPGGEGYVAITQSGFGGGFANPFLTKINSPGGRFLQVSYPKNGDQSVGTEIKDGAQTPWNVILVGSSLDALVNSDIVESLAPPPDPKLFPDGAATAWARPGRSVWDWMARFPGGITSENAKLNSDWAGQLGWEYNTIDEGWGRWNNGNPWPEVREITSHAASRGVKILLWVRSSNLSSQSQRTDFFKKCKAAGASGFKADFFDFDSVSPASKERVQLVEDILKEAAAYQLVVNLHGTGKPLGQFRTYPNLLNFEAVYGKEQYPKAVDSVHAPFTRLLSGPADYTPLGLADKLRGKQTAAFEIATMVNMAGPLITLSERSDTMAQSAFAPVIRSIPCLWDETRVLQGSEIGESCIMARRKGDMWYAAIMNVKAQRSWVLPLDFLTSGITYQAEIVRDAGQQIDYRTVTRETKLDVTAAAGGGFVAKFTIPATAAVTSLPFITHFGSGRGSMYAEKGKVLSTEPWASPLLADRLPDTLWSISSTGTPLYPEIDYSDAYQGGASLKVSGTLDATNDLSLYQTNLVLTDKTALSLAFKRGRNAAEKSSFQVGLKFADAAQSPVFLDAREPASGSWGSTQLDLSPYAGRTLIGVHLRFDSESVIGGYEMRIGGIAIYNTPLTPQRAPAGLHVEQLEFRGLDSLDAVLKWNTPGGDVRHYRIYQKNPESGQLVWLGATSENWFDLVNARRLGDGPKAVFEVAAVGESGRPSPHVAASIDLPERPSLAYPLTGSVIGTEGTFDKSAGRRDAVFDNNVTTYFDASTGNGIWAGLDVGASGVSKVTAIRYFPRELWPDRMIGGLFQGANQNDFSDAVVLARIDAAPRAGEFTLLEVKNGQAFRYLRYLSPDDGWGNVAEVQFFGPSHPAGR